MKPVREMVLRVGDKGSSLDPENAPKGIFKPGEYRKPYNVQVAQDRIHEHLKKIQKYYGDAVKIVHDKEGK